jgi:hypothetical protein
VVDKMTNSGKKSQIFFVLQEQELEIFCASRINIILEAQKISGSCFQNSPFYHHFSFLQKQ